MSYGAPLAWVAILFSSCSLFTRELPVDTSHPSGLEAACAKSCANHAANCQRGECERGCNLILDRLAEHEGEPVIACVARSKGRCGDWVWAHCAVQVGPHADGGPPAPPPPSDDVEE
jgi:hypothetical protein